jgi:DNA-binding CsgD family transcriptional regulator
MDQLGEVADLCSILASAPGHPLFWNRFLNELVRQLACDSSAMLITDLNRVENTRFLFGVHISSEDREKYESKLNVSDAFNLYVSENPGRVFYNQLLNDDFKVGEVLPEGQCYRFGVAIACNRHYALSLLLQRKSGFDEEEQAGISDVLYGLMPSLDEAIHAEQRHKISSQLAHHLGSRIDGYIIVDCQLNIIFSEPIFKTIISQMDCVKISGNRFGMTVSTIEQRLLALIERNEGMKSLHNQCRSCQITLIPISDLKNLYQWECYKDCFVLTFAHERDKNPAIDRLIEIYHLSRCEAICAIHFMNTPSIADIATSTFRSQETVRNHIKHTMQKMDVHSQAELMKKLITIAAL